MNIPINTLAGINQIVHNLRMIETNQVIDVDPEDPDHLIGFPHDLRILKDERGLFQSIKFTTTGDGWYQQPETDIVYIGEASADVFVALHLLCEEWWKFQLAAIEEAAKWCWNPVDPIPMPTA